MDSCITTKKEAKVNVDIYVLSRIQLVLLYILLYFLYMAVNQTSHYLLLEGLCNSSVKPNIFGGEEKSKAGRH